MNVQSKLEAAHAALGNHTYRNPSFTPDPHGTPKDLPQRTMDMAYDVHALINTAKHAFGDNAGGSLMTQRGIESTLEIACNMASDLIDLCEDMMRAVEKAAEAKEGSE